MARIDERWNGHREELEAAARTAGVDVGVMVKIAGFESGFNPEARPIAVSHPESNTVRQFDGTMAVSSAYGYGQFLDGTWQDMINRYGEKYGVAGAADMSRAQANAAELRQDTRLQSDVAANVYAMHNLGTGDGPRFLEALRDHPDAPAERPGDFRDWALAQNQAQRNMQQQQQQWQPGADAARLPGPAGCLCSGSAAANAVAAPHKRVDQDLGGAIAANDKGDGGVAVGKLTKED